MAYYECSYKDDIVGTGDSFTVNLTGSHNTTTTATICYINKTTICLLGDSSLGSANWTSQCAYAWYYTVNINNKEYTGTCRIPTFEQIIYVCAGYKRGFSYWTSTRRDKPTSWYVGGVGNVEFITPTDTGCSLPFITITL